MNPDFRKSMPRTPSTSTRNTYGRESIFGRASFVPTDIPSTAKRQSVLPPRSAFKDVRPVQDKHYQNELKERIRQFMAEGNAPGFNEKMLSEPNRNHFIKMFEFIYQYLDPNMDVNIRGGNINDQILAIFTSLRYPVQLKQSDLQCLSAPHIWAPRILPALDWLIGLIILKSEQDGLDLHSVEFDSKASHKDSSNTKLTHLKGITNMYYATCFKRKYPGYGHAENNYEYAQENNRFKQLVEEYEKVDDPTRDTITRREYAEAELNELDREEEAMNMEKTKEAIYDLENRLKAAESRQETIDLYLKETQRKISDASDELSQVKEEVAKVRTDNEEKRRLLATQKMSGNEARACRSELESLRLRLRELQDRVKGAEREKWDIQQILYKENYKVDDQFKEFTSRLRERALESMNESCSENLVGIHIVDDLDPKREDFLQNGVSLCRQAIENVIIHIENKTRRLQDDLQDARMTANKREMLANQYHETITKINKETIAQINQYQRDFDDIRKELHQVSLELDCLSKKMDLVLQEVNKERNRGIEFRSRNAELSKKYSEKRQARENEFQEIVAKLSEHLSILLEKHDSMRKEAISYTKTAKEMKQVIDAFEQLDQRMSNNEASG